MAISVLGSGYLAGARNQRSRLQRARREGLFCNAIVHAHKRASSRETHPDADYVARVKNEETWRIHHGGLAVSSQIPRYGQIRVPLFEIIPAILNRDSKDTISRGAK